MQTKITKLGVDPVYPLASTMTPGQLARVESSPLPIAGHILYATDNGIVDLNDAAEWWELEDCDARVTILAPGTDVLLTADV